MALVDLVDEGETVIYVSEDNGFVITEKEGVQKMYPPGYGDSVQNVFARLSVAKDESFEAWYKRIKSKKILEATSKIRKAKKDIKRAENVLLSFKKSGS